MSRFKISIEHGIKNAELANRHISEIDSIFDELDADIRDSSDGKVSFERVPPDVLVRLRRRSEAVPQKGKIGNLVLKNNSGKEEVVATWEQAPDGYPFSLEFDDSRNDCWDEQSLVNVLNEIVSTGSFWISVRKLVASDD